MPQMSLLSMFIKYYNPTSVCMPNWMGSTAATQNSMIFEYYLLEGKRKYLMIILFSFQVQIILQCMQKHIFYNWQNAPNRVCVTNVLIFHGHRLDKSDPLFRKRLAGHQTKAQLIYHQHRSLNKLGINSIVAFIWRIC